MKLSKIIKDVEKISIFSDGILYKSSKNELFSLKEESVILLDKVYDYEVFNQSIFYQESNLEALYILNLYFQKKEFISGIFSLRGAFHINENNIYILGKENTSKVIYIFDTKTFLLKSIVNANYFPKLSANNLCFCEKKDAIYCFDSLLNNNLWSYSLPEGFKIFGAPEIIDNVVYILAYTSHFQESHRIGLDIETGNKIWEISGGVDKNTTPIHAKTFNPKDKLLYGLYKTFQVFNPKTGKLLVNKIIEKANEDHFDAYSKAIYDDKLWFVSGKYENCKFGYISLKTNEIEFLQDFPQENDEIFDTPIFHQNKLYLRGKYYNNLYIFE